MKLKCPQCKRFFPGEFITLAFSTVRGHYQTCPICALKISNKDLGIKRNCFDGEIAEEMRQRALEYLRTL